MVTLAITELTKALGAEWTAVAAFVRWPETGCYRYRMTSATARMSVRVCLWFGKGCIIRGHGWTGQPEASRCCSRMMLFLVVRRIWRRRKRSGVCWALDGCGWRDKWGWARPVTELETACL